MASENDMIHVTPESQPLRDNYALMTSGIGPRPIALVSTCSADGANNLAPFSYFNAFSSNPPVVAFSTTITARTGAHKDTYSNLIATKECVVHSVTYAMAEQINLAATSYPLGVDEFRKSGLTPVDSHLVRPKRVKESPLHMECKLHKMIELGEPNQPGSGHVAFCEVIKFHYDKRLLKNGVFDQPAFDLIGRLGGEYYSRTSDAALFTMRRLLGDHNLGFDGLPKAMLTSKVYSGNELARFAAGTTMPSSEEAQAMMRKVKPLATDAKKFAKLEAAGDYRRMVRAARYAELKKRAQASRWYELTAKCAIAAGETELAWKIAVYATLL